MAFFTEGLLDRSDELYCSPLGADPGGTLGVGPRGFGGSPPPSRFIRPTNILRTSMTWLRSERKSSSDIALKSLARMRWYSSSHPELIA